MLRLFLIFHIIGCIMCIIAMYIGGFNHHRFDQYISIFCASLYCISFIPTILFYTIIVWKTPSFNDHFYISWEARWHSKILLLSPISFIIVCAIYAWTGSYDFASIPAVTLFTFILFAMCCISTIGIIHKNAANQNQQRNDLDLDVNKSPNADYKLEDMFTNEQTMNLFMVHLSKELIILT